MIYILPEEYYVEINKKMPEGIDFGYYDSGQFYFDDVIIPHLPFDIDITLVESIGKTYDELVLGLSLKADFDCKIYSYMTNDSLVDVDRSKPPFGHDYKAGLTIRLQPKRTTIKGEVIQVDYFADAELTNKILTVEINYTRDTLGFATKRETIRRWVLNNEEYHQETKTTEKSYTVNVEDQIKEGLRRRQNIVDRMQPTVLGLLFQVMSSQGKSQLEIIMIGRDFLDRHEPEFDRFIKSSSTITDPLDPNFGKKELAISFETASDTWLNETPAALGGASIRQYIISEVSI